MNPTQVASFDSDLGPTRRRLERNTYLVLAAMLVVSLIIGKWKIILGMALGGLLGLLNTRWLEASLRLIFSIFQMKGRPPRWLGSMIILRYVIIGMVIGLAVWSNYVNVLALIAGFCAFTWALMIEAGYQIYRMIIHPEE